MKGRELTCVVSVFETHEPEPPFELDELDPELPEPLEQLLRDAVTFFTEEWP